MNYQMAAGLVAAGVVVVVAKFAFRPFPTDLRSEVNELRWQIRVLTVSVLGLVAVAWWSALRETDHEVRIERLETQLRQR